jgi:hypothetical protein
VQQQTQVAAVDVLGHQVRAAVEQIEVDDLHHVAMVQARSDARLVDEHQRDALVGEQLGPDHLDHDGALEVVLALEPPHVDLTHAAARELVVDAVPAERGQHRGR